MSKFTLMIIGTIAIGMFALPGVISTFTGSHEYIAPDNVDCAKCHADVYTNIYDSADEHTHAGYTKSDDTVVWTLGCLECHNVSGIGLNSGGGHAAQKVNCAYCHDNSSFASTGLESYGDWAHSPGHSNPESGLMLTYDMECTACHESDSGSKNNMFLDDVFKNIVNPNAAHNGFYENADESPILLGATEACIACHTHVEFNVTEPIEGRGMTYGMDTGEFELDY